MWLINILGIALIAFVVCWFWLWTPKVLAVANDALQKIVVENGSYQPSNIVVSLGKQTTLQFLRKDQSPCAGTVLLPEWDISAELPLDEEVEITINPEKTGVFPFTCQMQMYRGEIHVVGEESSD